MPGNESPEATFGEELKRHRLLREVSLESIASATKISVRHLQALERGDVQRLPAPVFTRGFIRAYADFLGLEPEELVNAYLSEVGGSGRAQSIGAEPRVSRAPSKGLVVLAVVAVAVAVLIAAGIWRHAHRSRPVPARSAVLPPVSLSPHIRQVPVSSDVAAAVPQTPAPSTADTSTAPVQPDSAAAVPQTPSASMADASLAPVRPGPAAAAGPGPLAAAATDSLSLSIRLDADCWGEVFGDDRKLFSGIFRRGDERRFEARKAFRLTFGNAGAARISVNGQALPPLGRPGEVVRNFRIDSGRVQEILSGRG